MAPPTIETWLESLSTEDLALVNRLRGIVRAAGPQLEESIKWNAPSFALDGTDCVTLGLDRKGGARMVLHRGARAKTPAGFRFDDPDGLARWPSADRGVIQLASLDDVEAKEGPIGDLVSRWLAALG